MATEADAGQGGTIDLKILSPSPEAAGGLRFQGIPLSTKVLELKQRIQSELPTRPPIERLRVIYLGRVARDEESLTDILRQSLDQDATHVLHLVISDHRPRNFVENSRSTSMPPDGRVRAPPSPFALPPNAPGRIMSRPPSTQHLRSQTPQPSNGPRGAGQGGELHPQQVMNNLMNQHLGLHGMMPQGAAGAQLPPQLHQLMAHQQQLMHQLVNQQPTNNAGVGAPIVQPGQPASASGTHTPNQSAPGTIPRPYQGTPQNAPPFAGHSFVPLTAAPTPGQANNVTQVTSGLTPQGQRWTMTVNAGAIPLQPQFPGLLYQQQQQQQQHPHHHWQGNPAATAPMVQGFAPPAHRTTTPVPQHSQFLFPGQHHHHPNHSHHHHGGQSRSTASSPGTTTPNMPRSISPVRQPVTEPRSQETSTPSTSPNARQSFTDAPVPQPSAPNNSDEAMANHPLYLLQDPSGHAVGLIAPPGGPNYPVPLPADVLAMLAESRMPADELTRSFNRLLRDVYVSTVQAQTRRPVQTSNINPAIGGHQGLQAALVALAAPANQAPPQVGAIPEGLIANPPNIPGPPGMRRQPDEMRDALAPIIRNLWLVIRVAGLVYFVAGGGRVLWRPLILGLLLTVVYAIQAGLLGDRFDAARRWLDRIIGMEPRADDQRRQRNDQPEPGRDNEHRRRGGANDTAELQRPTNNANDPPALQRQNSYTPEDIARRLLNENRERNQTRLAQILRSIERTVGLLVASLWPGIGEQAVRLQHEREDRERRRVEEERKKKEEAEAAEQEAAEQEAKKLEGSNAESSAAAAARLSEDITEEVTELSDIKSNKGKAKAASLQDAEDPTT